MAQHQTEAFPSEKSSCRCIGNGNDPSSTNYQLQPVAQNGPDQLPQPNPRYARRNSMNAASAKEGDTCGEQGCDQTRSRNGSKKEHGQADERPGKGIKSRKTSPTPTEAKVVARLCGPSRSKCGYCGGKRLHVLGVKDGYNKIVIDEDESAQAEKKKIEQVDETKTSKSYGLLFDCLPYGIYEDLINHGWRRSGKHLYRPHIFESCCPAIPIRLDVLKFAVGCSSQQSNASTSRVEGSDFAKAILLRGSKSQRKVGKAVLRALEFYNSKCVRGHSGLSSDDSVHTSHVAKIQLDDSIGSDLVGSGRHDKEKVISDPNQDGVSCQSEPKHQHKKSRQQSPDRDHDKSDDNSLITKQLQSNSPAVLKITVLPSSNTDAIVQQSPNVSQEYLQLLLDKLSGVVYKTITNEAMKSVASSHRGGASGNGKQIEQPRWAWWNNDVTDEDISLPKWCAFKVSQTPGGSKDQRSGSTNGVSVMASTSACAAAAGRSRGEIGKNLIVRSVVDSLKKNMIDSSQQNIGESSRPELRVKEVSFHEKSGHVYVILEASPSAVIAAAKSFPSKYAYASKKSNLASNQRQCSKKVDEVDPIAEFITRYKIIAHKLNEPNVEVCTQNQYPHQQRFLTIRSVPSHESSLEPEVHQLFCRYQTSVHGDFDPFFGVNELSKEKDDDHDYAFYQQKNPLGFLDIDAAYSHLDEILRSKIKSSYLTFYRFLCETPVAQDEVPSIENLPNEDGYDIHIPFGTYHQQYRLSSSKDAFDGPLIAVGVADILPHCFSSVYAFYDPILSNSLELGKYTALREIEWVRRASQFRPELHYYYLGYYIHSCRKMTYKAEYKPSELLCPVNQKWVDFEDGKKRLEECSPIRHCCALFNDSTSPKQESNVAKRRFRIEDITLDIGEKEPHLVQVGMLNKQGREFIDPHVNEFVSEVGTEMCSKFVIKLR